MLRGIKLLSIAGLVLFFVWVLAKGFGLDPHEVPSVLAGRPAPDFSLTALGETTPVRLSAFKGKPVVLNFWATWCEPCKHEHEMLQNAARAYGDKVQFLGVVYQDAPEAVAAYLQRYGSTFTQLIDPESRTAIDYGVSGIPESFIIDATGVVVHKQTGVLTGELLISQLGEPPAQAEAEKATATP